MKYKKRGVESRQREQNLPVLEMMTFDQLGTVTDDELYERLRNLEANKDLIVQAHCNPRRWEEEICYVRREIQIRRNRREQHTAFVERTSREIANNQAAEKHLPSADLDNTRFIVAA